MLSLKNLEIHPMWKKLSSEWGRTFENSKICIFNIWKKNWSHNALIRRNTDKNKRVFIFSNIENKNAYFQFSIHIIVLKNIRWRLKTPYFLFYRVLQKIVINSFLVLRASVLRYWLGQWTTIVYALASFRNRELEKLSCFSLHMCINFASS